MHTELILHLSLIPSIGPATIDALLKRLPPKSDIYTFSISDFVSVCGMSAKTSAALVAGLSNKQLLENELELIHKHRIKITTRYDNDYPELLKHIASPPAILYYQGELYSSKPSIAVIGSRDADYYGKAIIADIVPKLVAQGYTIVSGGARGADTMAHTAALQAHGRTIAILGSGLLKPYPLNNKKMFEAIASQGGAIVSPFALSTQAMPGNFPARNRIIAGMSQGCLVVQAALQSGARITAQFALDQGREVFAVPGPVTSPLSAGCHALLKQGAHLVANAADILGELGHESTPEVSQSQEPGSQHRIPDQVPGLSSEQEAVLAACLKQSCSLENLLELTGFSMTQLMGHLFDLQLQGRVVQDGAGLWQNNG
ncbi:DNA polymerase [Candidatus Dependentiae bacterium Noda2021]|nr:DNA polymerase [Candidatus Dependentiae bacterium Noda2021]